MPSEDDAYAAYRREYQKHYMRTWRRGQAAKAEAAHKEAMKDPVEHARHAINTRWARVAKERAARERRVEKRKLKSRKYPTSLARI